MAGSPGASGLLVIGGDPVEVQVLPAIGARLHRIRAFGRDLLSTPASIDTHAADPYFWGGYVMAPWCNRIAPQAVTVGKRTVRPAPSFPDGTAIHGQVAAVPWTRRADGVLAVRGGGDGWPWPYEVTQEVVVTGASVRMTLRLTNLADDEMPAGIGLHPWFIGPLELAVASASVVPNVDPAAGPEPATGRRDLRAPQLVPLGLDDTWLDVGDPAVELRWPRLGLEATVRLGSDAPPCVAVASPEGAGAVAVEPQTHAPWGLARYLAGDRRGLRALAPGGTLELSITLDIRRTS